MKPTEIQLTPTKGETLTLLFFCLSAIPLVFLWLAWTQILHTTTIGLLFFLVIGVCYLVSQLAQDQPEYIINDTGIRFGVGIGGHFIRWTDIEEICDEWQHNGPRYVALRLRSDTPYSASMTALRKQLQLVYGRSQESGPTAHIHTVGLEASHQEILSLLHDYFQKHRHAASVCPLGQVATAAQ